MTYDTKDGYVLLFGGLLSNETWKFAGGRWTELFPATRPPGAFGQGMTYDPKLGYVVLLDANQTWKFLAGSWTLLATKHTPTEREAYSMTYDVADGYILLFGGINLTGAYLGDTWKFTGGDWSRIATPTHPSPRAFTSMVYDAADGYVVLFGGCHIETACTTGYFLADTWEFAGGKWTITSPTSHPSPRAGAMLTYDANDGYVLLFAGCNSTNCSKPFGDTWEYLAGAWTQLTPARHPASRVLGSIAYDPKAKAVLLFGGAGAGFTLLNDTWVFADGSWSKA